MLERDLLKGLKNSDEKTFEYIFREHFRELINYAFFYTGSLQTAEDIVQDIFLKIWNFRKDIEIRSNIRVYLLRSVHNECIQYLRHQSVIQKHNSFVNKKYSEIQLMNQLYTESGLTFLFEKEIGALVNDALKSVPDKTREIFILSRNSYLKNSEIAQKLELTEKSIEYHISRALDILRKQLKDYLPF